MSGSTLPWFENLPGAREGSPRLFCFPYAGGSAQAFRSWQRQFAPDVSLSLAHLPGRGPRIGEPAITRLKLLIEALADAIAPHLQPAFAFWGHSMGALISFELARELRRRREAGPIAIFVSGRPAPQLPDAERITYNLPEQEFLDELRRLNGTPRELLDSPELRELFVPTIRADFQVVETYTYTADEPLSCAVYAYGGLQDGSVPAEKLRGWQAQTSGPSKVRMFPGDHFYIHSSGDLVHMLHRDVLDLLVHGKIDLRTAAPKIRR